MVSEKIGFGIVGVITVGSAIVAAAGGILFGITALGYLFPGTPWACSISFLTDESFDRAAWYSFFTEMAGWPICHLLMNFIGFFFTTSWVLVFVRYPYRIYWKRNMIFWMLSLFQLVGVAVIWEIFEAGVKSGTVVLSNMNLNNTLGQYIEFAEESFYETVNNIVLSDLLMPFLTSAFGIVLVEIGAFVPPAFLFLERSKIRVLIRVVWITAIGWIEFLHVGGITCGSVTYRVGWWMVMCMKIAMFGLSYVDDALVALKAKKGIWWLNEFYIYFYSLMLALWGFAYIDLRNWGVNFYIWVFPMALGIGIVHSFLTFVVALIVRLKIFMGNDYATRMVLKYRAFREKTFDYEKDVMCPSVDKHLAETLNNQLSFSTMGKMEDNEEVEYL